MSLRPGALAVRVLAGAAALVVVFGGAFGVGRLVGPVEAAATTSGHSAETAGGHGAETAGGHGAETAGGHGGTQAPVLARGLSAEQDGYALRLDRSTLAPGRPELLTFTVDGPDGRPATRFTHTHDKDLHLVVVRRDLQGFAHLHPTRDAAGRWSVPLTLPGPGPYKVIADFTPVGHDAPLGLAADLTAPGAYAPAPLPADSRAATVDGYTVTLDGRLRAGTSSTLTLRVARDGRPVTDLQPYLGAFGHLVVLRAADLAYLHVHPEDDGAAGPEIAFSADVPAAGPHRLFLQFQHRGVVRTAELTATAAAAGTAAQPSQPGR